MQELESYRGLSPNIQPDLCFVLLPLRPPFLKTYEEIIRPAAKNAGLYALHAQEIYGTNAIISDIWEHMWKARVVIADVSGRNPNVNYELGICHTLGVPTLLITKDIDDVPFDYRHRRVVIYKQENPKWGDELQRDVENSLRAILDGGVGLAILPGPTNRRHLWRLKRPRTSCWDQSAARISVGNVSCNRHDCYSVWPERKSRLDV